MKHLVLLHGALGSPEYFEKIKEALSGEYILHTLTFAGHAGTALPNDGLRMQNYVAQLVDFCDTLPSEPLAFFGYSMGGYVALAYAAQYPERVSAVMTLATKLQWSPEIAAREVKMLQPAAAQQKVPQFAAYLSGLHGSERWAPLMQRIADMLLALGENPLLTDVMLSKIHAPVQLMVGDKDNMVSIEETMQVYRSLKNATLAVLPNTVHPFEKINTPMLLQLMRDFFK